MSARAIKVSAGFVAVLITVAALSLLSATGVNAGPGVPFVFVDPVSEEVTQPTFTFELDPAVCLSDTVVTVDGVPDAQVTLDDPNSGTIVLPADTPGGGYDVTLVCTTDSGTQTFQGFIEFGHVVVEKVVTGEAPADATFVVAVDCAEGDLGPAGGGAYGGAAPEGFTPTGPLHGQLSFGADGGTGALVHYRSQDCTITEPEDGGATSTTIVTSDCGGDRIEGGVEADSGASGDFFIGSAVDCTQTVTNDFAAEAVAVTPAFTG